MSTYVSEALNADQMSVPLFTGGMSKVGFGISGTWVGTIAFYGSFDGVSFIPVSVTPFASGTTVTTTTATGSWERAVENFVVFKAVFTRTSGTAIVKIAASLDSSYQDAFLAPTTRYVNQEASGATNTVTIAAQANRAWCLKVLVISNDTAATWAAQPHWKVTDGASSVIWAGNIPTTAGQANNIVLPPDGLAGTPGNSMVITVASAGGSVKVDVNAFLTAA